MTARRITRWLRLFVACLAFLVATPRPITVAGAIDEVVLVAEVERREEARAAADRPFIDVPAAAPEEEVGAPRFESLRLVSDRWLDDCAFLL